MSDHYVDNKCAICDKEIQENEKVYYLAPCKLKKPNNIWVEHDSDVRRVVFPGGVRKDRVAICEKCISPLPLKH